MTMNLLKHRSAAIAATLVSAGLVLGACSSDDSDGNDAAEETRTVKADNGDIEVPAEPERVAVLTNAVMPYLDMGGTPAAVTDLSAGALADLPADQQAAYRSATNVADGDGNVDYEKLASVDPDVIIIATNRDSYDDAESDLTSIAPTILLDQASDWKSRVTATAEGGNLLDAYGKQKDAYDTMVSDIRDKYSDTLKNRKLVEAYYTSTPGMFSINGSLCAEAISEEGLIDFTPVENQVSLEKVGSLSPYDVILYSVGSDGAPSEEMKPVLETEAWKALPAVKADNAQPVYCPWGRSYGFMTKYLEGLDHALAAYEEHK